MCRDGSPQQDHQPLPHVWGRAGHAPPDRHGCEPSQRPDGRGGRGGRGSRSRSAARGPRGAGRRCRTRRAAAAPRPLRLARRRPPRPHGVLARREVPRRDAGRAGPRVRRRLDGVHRALQRRAPRQGRAPGAPGPAADAAPVPRPAHLPGPGVVHPGGRALHRHGRARRQRRRSAAPVREAVGRQAQPVGEAHPRDPAGRRVGGQGGRGAAMARGRTAPWRRRRRAGPRQPPAAAGHRLAARAARLA